MRKGDTTNVNDDFSSSSKSRLKRMPPSMLVRLVRRRRLRAARRERIAIDTRHGQAVERGRVVGNIPAGASIKHIAFYVVEAEKKRLRLT